MTTQEIDHNSSSANFASPLQGIRLEIANNSSY